MAKLISIFFAALLILVAAACSDSSTNSNSGALTMGTMKCKVDGSSWQSMNAMATKAGTNAINISGANYNIQTQVTETVSFTIVGSIVEGPSNNVSIAQYSVGSTSNPMGATLYNSTSASINITTVNDSEISGTFSFTGSTNAGASKNITEGQFRVKFVN
ncbi:MAG: hypothetical protein KGZ71_11065 [Desulfobulbaceae bacterium]|nr:hypothetical protein [Desulfobulbaceae bacterium]